MSQTLYTSGLHSLALLARGKVRDNYAVSNDRILMVASDRISAYDVVMGQPIPGKGILLTQMALFWFERLQHLCPNHLTGEDPCLVVQPDEVDQVKGRSMLVRRLKPIPIEAVVRGYLAGSGWKEYQQGKNVCGVPLPDGLQNASPLPQPIYTPAAKAEIGEHDENITFECTVDIVGMELAQKIRDISIALYTEAMHFARQKGLIIADTKFEFGLDQDGTLVLMDEVLTPDSSRYWPLHAYAEAFEKGENPPSFDKQYLRDWLESVCINGKPWNKTPPAPTLPLEVIQNTMEKYQEALEKLTA
jgi:phosphoribosylaminoimidazole-succinocarboxamide synthase